ncbi:MAG: hypothetical protein ACRCV3_02060 [Desulfovibrionaceae bacterium]
MKRKSTLSIFRNRQQKKNSIAQENEDEENFFICVAHSRSYTVLFWTKWIISLALLSTLIFFLPQGWMRIISYIGIILPLPFLYVYKVRVLDRSRIYFSGSVITIQRGRWFILDDDVLYANAIDYIRIDRNVIGYFLGWCSLEIITRNGSFAFNHMDLKSSELLRANIIH